MKTINELILSYTIPIDQYCDEIDKYCETANIKIVKPCTFNDSVYSIIIANILHYDKFRELLTNIELLCRSHGRYDMYIISSSLGLKITIKVYDQYLKA